MINLKILGQDNAVKFEASGTALEAVYESKYAQGDSLLFTLDGCDKIALRLDETMAESLVFIPDGTYAFPIPFEMKAKAYHPDAWNKEINKICARVLTDEEFYAYRNIALNSAAVRFDETCFPYAKANVVTRDEAWFEERNSIDGIVETSSHGAYPYQSYAGGAREDIDYTLFFGKKVELDRLVFYLRADFKEEHDTYWKSFTAELSDGTQIPMTFEKTGEAQEFKFDKSLVTESIRLKDFKQAAFPLSWAALTQIEVYGRYLR